MFFQRAVGPYQGPPLPLREQLRLRAAGVIAHNFGAPSKLLSFQTCGSDKSSIHPLISFGFLTAKVFRS